MNDSYVDSIREAYKKAIGSPNRCHCVIIDNEGESPCNAPLPSNDIPFCSFCEDRHSDTNLTVTARL